MRRARHRRIAGLHRPSGRGVLAEPTVGRSVAGAHRQGGDYDRGGYGGNEMMEIVIVTACTIGMILLSPDDWWKL